MTDNERQAVGEAESNKPHATTQHNNSLMSPGDYVWEALKRADEVLQDEHTPEGAVWEALQDIHDQLRLACGALGLLPEQIEFRRGR